LPALAGPARRRADGGGPRPGWAGAGALMKQDALRASRSEAEARPGAVDLDALADLEEQRRFLLQSLRDLDREREAGDLDDDDYRTLKDDYTGRTAEVLRTLDASKAGVVAAGRRTRRSEEHTSEL